MHILQKKRAYSMIQLLIALGILSIVMLGIFSVISMLLKGSNQAQQIGKIQGLRQEIITTLRNDKAWRYTVNAAINRNPPNPAFTTANSTCLASPGTNCSNGQANLRFFLKDVADKFAFSFKQNPYIYPGTANPVHDFDLNGLPCNAFQSVGGNDSCPLRLELRWRAVCDAAITDACKIPQIEITGTFTYLPQNRSQAPVLNTANLNFLVIRSYMNFHILQSCLQIKNANLAAGHGYYLLDPKGDGKTVLTYCDMDNPSN